MAAFEKWEMGDPEAVAMRREAERMRKESECGTCLYKCERVVRREVEYFCQFRKRTYGKKCDLFKFDPVIRWEESCK